MRILKLLAGIVASALPTLCGAEFSIAVSSGSSRLIVVRDQIPHIVVVNDIGDHAEIVRIENVVNASSIHSPFISSDGKHFGVVVRSGPPLMERFYLFEDGTRTTEIFAAFGDSEQTNLKFAVNNNGKSVVTPGRYGVVCWKKFVDEWKESWALDEWKKFQQADAMEADGTNRIQSFNAFIPPGANYVFLLKNGPSNVNQRGDSTAHDLSDGTVRPNANAAEADALNALRDSSAVAVKGNRTYSIGKDGTLKCADVEGELAWTLDYKATLNDPRFAKPKDAEVVVIKASRPPTASRKVPSGENLLRTGNATLTLHTLHAENIGIEAESLVNGKFDDVETAWLKHNESGAATSEQIFAEITFKEPRDVQTMTVYENNSHPETWPSESWIQIFDNESQKWKTIACGLFLIGPVNTYRLNAKSVSKIRYMPWNSGGRIFYTSEIEVR